MTTFGETVRTRRKALGLSQMALAERAEISTRHLSFMETGRSNPSREMVLILGNALDLPLRERNSLLTTGGFAPVYEETDLATLESGPVKQALDFMMKAQEPYPLVAMDSTWVAFRINESGRRFFDWLAPGLDPLGMNVTQATFTPMMMQLISNWGEVAGEILVRLSKEAARSPRSAKLLAEILQMPGAAELGRTYTQTDAKLVLPVRFDHRGEQLTLFTTITTLGTPTDVAAQELRLEGYWPGDEQTREFFERLAES